MRVSENPTLLKLPEKGLNGTMTYALIMKRNYPTDLTDAEPRLRRRTSLHGLNIHIQYEDVDASQAWRYMAPVLGRDGLIAGFLTAHLAPRRVSRPLER